MQEELAEALPDGLYRISAVSQIDQCLEAHNGFANASIQVKNGIWPDDVTVPTAHHQGWVIAPVRNHAFLMAPRDAWWQAPTTQEDTSIGMSD